MRRSGWTPSIVPPEVHGEDQNVYIVLYDFGRNGRAYRETDLKSADLETMILGLLDGRRISREQLPKSCAAAAISNQDFAERHKGRDRQLTLRLA